MVHPLGVAAKGSVWYLVAGTEAGLRTFRVDRITSVDATGEPVERPADFDLAEAWRMITDEVDQKRAPVVAHAVADPAIVGWLRMGLGTRLRIGPTAADGRVELELRGHMVESLAGELAGYGQRIEIARPAGAAGAPGGASAPSSRALYG